MLQVQYVFRFIDGFHSVLCSTLSSGRHKSVCNHVRFRERELVLRHCALHLEAIRWLIIAVSLAGASNGWAACELRSADGAIKHVVQLQFDNLHLRRDDPNIASDIEQMPFLHAFLTENGVLAGDHHTSLPSVAATDILTILTGVYPDRTGIPTSDNLGYFQTDGSVGFTSSFSYWTATAPDGFPQMLTEAGKMAPAPWPAFTRVGCDVGTFGVANMAIESIPSDIISVFGGGTPEAAEAAANPVKAKADFLGIAVHCAEGSGLCANAVHARADHLPDEPGSYNNFSALFGNAHVQPAISPNGPVRDLDHKVIQDVYGDPGFPGVVAPTVSQTLGYTAAMLEAGIPVVYAHINDPHDGISVSGARQSLGPGEAAYDRRLGVYDRAFERFIRRLEVDGITKANTLFVFASDVGGHFVGGAPVPKTCNGAPLPCAYPDRGEINVFVDRLLATQFQNVTAFDIHFDTAPSFFIRGNPSAAAPITRALEQDVGKLTIVNPISGHTDSLTHFIADRTAMTFLHMTSSSPARTPSFTAFSASDYFVMTAGNLADCSSQSPCAERDPSYSWTHGNAASDMSLTWFGLVGPGVRKLGLDESVFSDHADIRPTMLALLGLADDYVHDGRVLAEWIEPSSLAPQLRGNQTGFLDLAKAYKALNAPLGKAGTTVLALATQAVEGSDQDYARFVAMLDGTTHARDLLAHEIKSRLDEVAFGDNPVSTARTTYLERTARALVQSMTELVKGDAHSASSTQ